MVRREGEQKEAAEQQQHRAQQHIQRAIARRGLGNANGFHDGVQPQAISRTVVVSSCAGFPESHTTTKIPRAIPIIFATQQVLAEKRQGEPCCLPPCASLQGSEQVVGQLAPSSLVPSVSSRIASKIR